jgi:hypothetical protein
MATSEEGTYGEKFPKLAISISIRINPRRPAAARRLTPFNPGTIITTMMSSSRRVASVIMLILIIIIM